ncbi:MAG TPA: M14 family zinc carboxypeptidase [Gemmatimonadaceae bacterium]|nr:M14 family zinc carboxypeptidase [Gemmatimonadaceae bacterium]
MHRRLLASGLALAAQMSSAQQPIDSAYTKAIIALTPTDSKWKFSTELVDYMPASATVPTPLKVLGYVPGTIGRLSKTADVNKYFRALAAASPRVKVFTAGMSDEGREMLAVAIGDEQTIAALDEYKAKISKLSDTRGLSQDERTRLIHEAKPIYWLTGSIHSPETGSPEMLMELAYRLAVDESPHVQAIRKGVITLITPILETDGRDREVDAFNESRALKIGAYGVPLIYWGKYTAHDNNRDAMVLSQKLTQAVAKTFLEWHPTIAHDLHESVPFLYTSTGTGPYNDEFDPILVDELHTLAYQEITELTRRGLPGVWTHGFYDGWAPNYTILSVASLHNSIGRFYETYTSRGAECHPVHLGNDATDRRWDRSNPPVNGIKWCIRTNINYQQSGVLIALRYVADHKETFLQNYVAKVDRSIKKGQTTAPYAFVIPHDQRHAGEAAALVNLFRAQGTEVSVASNDFSAKEAPRQVDLGSSLAPRDSGGVARLPGDTAPTPPARPVIEVRKGDWIVRMDQPYTGTVRTLLATQKFGSNEPPPYDDTGWTLDLLRHVVVRPVADSSVLAQPMTKLDADATVSGTVSGSGSTLVVRNTGDWRAAALPWKLKGAKVAIADTSFTVGDQQFPAGTFIVDGAQAKSISDLGLNGVAGSPSVKRHAVALPRIALMHTWIETQNEGWVRFAFDQMGIPYTSISDQGISKPAALDKFDVIVFPHVGGPPTAVINGRPMIGPPIPWKKTATTPDLGLWDATDDVRPGMGFAGAAALEAFVQRGGLLITEGSTSALVSSLGFSRTVQAVERRQLRANGSILRVQEVDRKSPLLYGYDDEKAFPAFFGGDPVLAVVPRDTLEVTVDVDSTVLREAEAQRAKVILRYYPRPDSLLLSGLMAGAPELIGKAALVDAPVGKGHMVLFGIRPLWRWESQGTFAIVLNAMANWDHLTQSP